MNNIIERTWKQGCMVGIEELRGLTFQNEALAHTFKISGVDADGSAIALTGTPAGVMLRADNMDVALTCALSDGCVMASLPAECYDVPGRAEITIYLTEDGHKVCIYAAIVSVNRTSSGTASPGTAADVVDLVNLMQTSVDAAENSATDAAGSATSAAASAATASAAYNVNLLAPNFVQENPYPAGQHVIYDGGYYVLPNGHEANVTWENTSKTQLTVGGEATDLKSAIRNYNSEEYIGTVANTSGSRNGISYSVNDGVFTLSGTATAGGYVYRIYNNQNVLPDWFKAGEKVVVRLNKTGNMDDICLYISGYHSGGSNGVLQAYTDGEYILSNEHEWTGLSITIYTNNEKTCNGTIKPQIFNAFTNEELQTRVIAVEQEALEIPGKLNTSDFDNLLYYEDLKSQASCNLLNPDAVMYGYKLDTRTEKEGLPREDANYWLSDFMPVATGDLVSVTVNGTLTTLNSYCTYNASKQYISRHEYIKQTSITDENTAYIRVCGAFTITDPRTDKVQIQIGQVTEYEPYGTWFAPKNEKKTVAIAPSGGDYSSIRTAFETEGTNTLFLIYPGTYNVANDFTAEEINNASYDSNGNGFVGVRVKDGCILKGVGDKRNIIIKCELNAETYSYTKRVNISTLNLFGDCEIENLTVLAINARTPIHDDFKANINKTHIIRNCTLRNEVSERTTSHGYGLGLVSGESVTIEGCDIYPTMVCHSNNAFASPASFKLVDSDVYSLLVLQDLTSGQPVYVDIINSTYGIMECSSNNVNKAMKIRIASETDSPIVIKNATDISGFMYQNLPARYAVSKGQIVCYSRTGNFNSTDMYRVAATTNVDMAIGVATNNANPGDSVNIIKLNKYVGSYECGIESVALGDHIGIDATGKLVVDSNGTFGVVVVMTAEGIGAIKLLN